MVHSLQHETSKVGVAKVGVVYSLSHHRKQSCLLTAGSRGPVRVWKVKGWAEEEEEEEEGEESRDGV